MKIERLRNLKKIVKEILENDELARKDDCYLILRIVQKLYPEDYAKPFYIVMTEAKYKGISFERNYKNKKTNTKTISRIKR